MKKMFFWSALVLAVIILPSTLSAQVSVEEEVSVEVDTVATNYDEVDEVIEVIDSATIDEDELAIDSLVTRSADM